MGNRECGRLKGNPCGPLRLNTINVTMPCSLPRTNPGNQHQYKRVNGPYSLILSRTSEYKLPFGNFPRLILAWVCTEVVRTRSRVVVLGPSLAKFMKTLGVYSSGGETRVSSSAIRCGGCSVALCNCPTKKGMRNSS